ncbi:MAG: DUF5017 domain-containing protein [Bacteroidetes bacterium]|nr:MAG: DUF5017 domain-containing protein [Bacteroidota bacterium]
MKYSILTLLFAAALLVGCMREDPVLELDISPSALMVDAGTPIDFTITGTADFLVFYDGTPGREYANYPKATALSINMSVDNPTFSYTYNTNDTVTATFVASSYGNWSESREEKVFEFEFIILDNNTNLAFASLKTPGLFGREYEGVIDPDASTVTVTIPAGTNLSNLTTTLNTESNRATITLDGAPFANKSVVNFSSGSRTFRVTAAGGATQDWLVQVVN